MSKIIRASFAAIGLALVAAAPAQATTTRGNAVTVRAESAAVRIKSTDVPQSSRFCVRAELPGSRIPQDICRTAREWDVLGGSPDSRR